MPNVYYTGFELGISYNKVTQRLRKSLIEMICLLFCYKEHNSAILIAYDYHNCYILEIKKYYNLYIERVLDYVMH